MRRAQRLLVRGHELFPTSSDALSVGSALVPEFESVCQALVLHGIIWLARKMSIVAIVDIETTGRKPEPYHRIVEIAVVIWDAVSDAVIAEFETLVNPCRAIGAEASEVHGLSATDLEGAPTFAELSTWLPALFDDRIVAGYNVKNFDISYLNEEFERAGSDFRISKYFCAMHQIPGNSFVSLSNACQNRGIAIRDAHTAMGDARATLELLREYGGENVLDEALGNRHRWGGNWEDAIPLTWSRYKAGLTDKKHENRGKATWELEDFGPRGRYLGLLSAFLDNRQLDAEEIAQLQQLAEKLGLTRADTQRFEKEWLEILEARARANAIVSEQEVERIGALASLVGLHTSLTVTDRPMAKIPSSGQICVTSSEIIDGVKWSLENLAPLIEKCGCEATNVLRKKNPPELLLCPDLNGHSKKSEMAKQWGIPMMTISQFLDEVSRS